MQSKLNGRDPGDSKLDPSTHRDAGRAIDGAMFLIGLGKDIQNDRDNL